jgi:hypothetical protein
MKVQKRGILLTACPKGAVNLDAGFDFNSVSVSFSQGRLGVIDRIERRISDWEDSL